MVLPPESTLLGFQRRNGRGCLRSNRDSDSRLRITDSWACLRRSERTPAREAAVPRRVRSIRPQGPRNRRSSRSAASCPEDRPEGSLGPPTLPSAWRTRSFAVCGGERGIRTLGTVARTPDFESGSFGHSDSSPPRNLRERPALSSSRAKRPRMFERLPEPVARLPRLRLPRPWRDDRVVEGA